jgi:hypothetical protein
MEDIKQKCWLKVEKVKIEKNAIEQPERNALKVFNEAAENYEKIKGETRQKLSEYAETNNDAIIIADVLSVLHQLMDIKDNVFVLVPFESSVSMTLFHIISDEPAYDPEMNKILDGIDNDIKQFIKTHIKLPGTEDELTLEYTSKHTVDTDCDCETWDIEWQGSSVEDSEYKSDRTYSYKDITLANYLNWQNLLDDHREGAKVSYDGCPGVWANVTSNISVERVVLI